MSQPANLAGQPVKFWLFAVKLHRARCFKRTNELVPFRLPFARSSGL
ncbi:MAG TPA: hypothetical protein VMS73_06115 [Anaerolineaceae bacterium]|nr:hypothetical protein [Anaerolineaceae bacterium]